MSFFDTKFETNIRNYAKNGILNTIFYGPPGSGKDMLAIRMLNSMGSTKLLDIDSCEIEQKGYWGDEDIPFYTTSNYIKFNGTECIGKVVKLVNIIEEISNTRNISKDIKIIYIKNLNCLQDKQEILRQVVEETFETCRFVFTVRNIDKVDPALNSRCMSIRVSSPNLSIFEKYIRNEIPHIPHNDINEIICSSMRNYSSLKIIVMYYKKFGVVCNVNREIALSILDDLENTTNIMSIHTLAERIFLSEINFLNVCKYFPLNKYFIQCAKNFSSTGGISLYNLIILFYNLGLGLCCEEK